MSAKEDYLTARWDAGVLTRFWSKVERAGDADCWIWKGPLSPGGYGAFSIDNRAFAAHRLLIVKQRQDALVGLVCDHLCRNRACVNPRHIEVVTNRENILRGDAGRLNSAKGAEVTHCPRGHPYTPENTRRNRRGSRICRQCGKISAARWTEKRRQLRALAAQEPSS